MKIITINIDEDALLVIDQGAKIEQRSRSNFLQFSALERAKFLGVK